MGSNKCRLDLISKQALWFNCNGLPNWDNVLSFYPAAKKNPHSMQLFKFHLNVWFSNTLKTMTNLSTKPSNATRARKHSSRRPLLAILRRNWLIPREMDKLIWNGEHDN